MDAQFGYQCVQECVGTATFHGFSALLLEKVELISDPVIKLPGFGFAVKVKPYGKQGDEISMFLGVQLVGNLVQEVSASYTIEVLGVDQQVKKRCHAGAVRKFVGESPLSWGFYGQEARAPWNYSSEEAATTCYKERLKSFIEAGWLVDDSLTLRLSMKIFVGKPGSLRRAPQCQEDGLKRLSSDFTDLLNGSVPSDITITCKDGQVGAHRMILATRSPVFRNMFQHEMQESSQGRIDISDVEVASLQLFLKYVYAGTLAENVGDEGLWVLTALAHKYDVQGLLSECTNRWLTKLAPENVAAVLQEADKFGITTLRQAALQFITQDRSVFERIQDSEGFKTLPAPLLQDLLARVMGARKRKAASDKFEVPDDSVWETLSNVKLKQALSERGLTTSGNKAQLIARLREHIAAHDD